MAIIEDSIEINAPQDMVYRISQDYGVRFDWDPFPDRLEMIGGGDYTPERGKRVYVRSKLGMSMVVEFVQVSPPSRAAIAMVSGPRILKKFAGTWIFEAISPERTHVRFRYAIEAAPAVLRPIIDALAAAYFRRTVRKRLLGLKRYCERSP
ncbi:MAG: SRPBCC family protein [Pseudomonas sp.]|nr:SRPBCC family protein [Pseudomonas sp.]